MDTQMCNLLSDKGNDCPHYGRWMTQRRKRGLGTFETTHDCADRNLAPAGGATGACGIWRARLDRNGPSVFPQTNKPCMQEGHFSCMQLAVIFKNTASYRLSESWRHPDPPPLVLMVNFAPAAWESEGGGGPRPLRRLAPHDQAGRGSAEARPRAWRAPAAAPRLLPTRPLVELTVLSSVHFSRA